MPGVDPEKIRRAYEADKDGDINNLDVDFRDSKIVSLAKKCHRLQMLLNKERATGYYRCNFHPRHPLPCMSSERASIRRSSSYRPLASN